MERERKIKRAKEREKKRGETGGEDEGTPVACVASVSVRLSARSMHFSLFWPPENWDALFCARPNFHCLEHAENLTETLATQARTPVKLILKSPCRPL